MSSRTISYDPSTEFPDRGIDMAAELQSARSNRGRLHTSWSCYFNRGRLLSERCVAESLGFMLPSLYTFHVVPTIWLSVRPRSWLCDWS